MKCFFASLLAGLLMAVPAFATTIMVVPVFEPLSLHGTDGDQAILDIGDALQACVMARPMALSGAFPEVLVDAISSPHQVPTNNPNYQVKETNLLVLCGIGLSGKIADGGLAVKFDISKLAIPADVDLTSRQVLKLALLAVRKTLEEYQRPQSQPLPVTVSIEGADEAKAPLKDIGTSFSVLGGADSH
jgi:hypothetical protein